MTIEEFLLKMIDMEEYESGFGDLEMYQPYILQQCAFKRKIVEWHQKWPVLVEKPNPPSLPLLNDLETYANTMSYQITKQVAWMTQEAYVETFGSEPPTAPMLREMAKLYSWHEDYREEWA